MLDTSSGLQTVMKAFNMTGGEKVWLCVHDLKEDLKMLHYASKEDDKRDDDHDGIPDVKQVMKQIIKYFSTIFV